MPAKDLPFKLLPVLVSVLLLTGCAGNQVSPVNPQAHSRSPSDDRRWIKHELYAQFDEWQAVPHRDGGLSKQGVDCSGFVFLTYLSKLGIKLPRDSDAQAHAGYPISAADLNAGDLVFFKTGADTRHVGIYLEGRRFMHVSTRKGVTISSLNDHYWAGKYWKAVRIIG